MTTVGQLLELGKSRGICWWLGRRGRSVERTGDREYRAISEDITVHLSSIWLRCGMKYQGFVYDWDLLWELLLFSHQVVSTSFVTPRPIACHGILQARILEWVAISFSNAWKWKVKVNSLSRVQLFRTPWTTAYQAPPPMGFSRQEYWSGLPLPFPRWR